MADAEPLLALDDSAGNKGGGRDCQTDGPYNVNQQIGQASIGDLSCVPSSTVVGSPPTKIFFVLGPVIASRGTTFFASTCTHERSHVQWKQRTMLQLESKLVTKHGQKWEWQ